MPNAKRGEVWLVDLGMVAKTRPAVLFNIPFADDERALYAIIPHTTATRGGRFEVAINVAWLEGAAFDIQGLRHLPSSVLIRKLGTLNQPQIDLVSQAIRVWLAAG